MKYIDCSPQASYVSKKAGRSAAAKHAYVTRSGKYERHTDKCVASETLGLPAFAHGDAAAYWRAADEFERKNGATLFEYIMPLPAGLSQPGQVKLCKRFARAFRSMFDDPPGAPVVTWGLHEGGGENPHVHFCFGTRLIDERASALSVKEFFKRGNVQNFGTNQNDKQFLEEMKRGWRDFANHAAKKEGIAVELVGGTLEDQRAQAINLMNKAQRAADPAARGAAYWWYIKTHRPVTKHLGQQAAAGDTRPARLRQLKYSNQKKRRDEFLENAAAATEITLIENGLPVPLECAEYAAKWRTNNPGAFPELDPNFLPPPPQPAAAPPPPPPPPPPPEKPAMSKFHSQFTHAPRDAQGRRRASTKIGRISTAPDANFDKASSAVRFKQKLWRTYYDEDLNMHLALNIAFIDAARGTFRTVAGDVITDLKDEIRTTQFNEITTALMIEQAKAKGWRTIELIGADEQTRARFAAAGFEIVDQISTPFNPPARPVPPFEIDADERARAKKASGDVFFANSRVDDEIAKIESSASVLTQNEANKIAALRAQQLQREQRERDARQRYFDEQRAQKLEAVRDKFANNDNERRSSLKM